MRAQNRVGGNDAGIQAYAGAAEVVFRQVQVGAGHLHLLQGLVKELALLGYLEVNHLFGIVQLVLVQTGFRLGFLVFEQGLAAMGDGNFHHDAGAQVAALPLVLEAVVDIRVGNGESAHEGHGGHEVCAHHFGFLVKDFGGQGEAAGLRAGLIDVFQALFHRAAGFRNHVQGFIGKDNGTV